MKVRVAVDTGPLTDGNAVRGVGRNTRELIPALKKAAKGGRFSIHDVAFAETDLSKFDIVHYQSFHPHFVSFSLHPEQKTVVTIHDLIQLLYPEHYVPGIRGKMKWRNQKKMLGSVDAITTISETSKKDIIRFANVDPEKVHAIHLATRPMFRKVSDKKLLAKVKKKYKLPDKFVLYVGDVNFNKNIPGLIRACTEEEQTLVIVGKHAEDIEKTGMTLYALEGPRDWFRFLTNKPHPEVAHYASLVREFRNNKKIIRAGFVSDEELVAMFNLATVYCQASFYEGFGLPPLEAMACGTATVVNKTQALVEITKGGVLVADAKKGGLGAAIKKAINNSKLRRRLEAKGPEVANTYSWGKTAKAVLNVYESLLN